MHPIKAKRIRKIVAAIKNEYPAVAAELESIVSNAMNPPHPKPKVPVQAGLQKAIQYVLQKVTEANAPIALAGGLAVIHWVDLRSSFDADFVVLSNGLEKIMKLFPGGRLLDLIYTVEIEGVDVDFLVPRDSTPWVDEAIKNAKPETVMGVPGVKVLTPEYLILYKFEAARPKDMDDIKGLLTLKGTHEKARGLVEKFLPNDVEDFDALAMEADYGL